MNIISKIGIFLGSLGLIIAVVFRYFSNQPFPVFTGYLVYGGVFLALFGNLANKDKKNK